MKKLRHKNIIELHHTFVEGNKLVMVMEYAGGGELLEFVTKRGRLSEFDSRKIMIQVTNAIHYCHNRGVIHRDLKLENVLFRERFELDDDSNDLFVKVIDFGIAGVCENGKQDKDTAGSIHYMAPELFEGVAVASSPALDTWSLGLMWYSMLYGTLPFYSDDEAELIEKIKKAKLTFDKTVPVTEECKEVIQRMLERDADKRLDLEDFAEMAYYKYEDAEMLELQSQCL